MRTRIKFCGMVDPGDVDDAVAIGADAIGLVFYERSVRHVDLVQARVLRARLPSFVSAVGLFVNAGAQEVQAAVRAVGLDVVQFHGDESQDTCAAAAGITRWWRAVRMRGPDDLLSSIVGFTGAEAFVLDTFSDGYGGAGLAFDWSWVHSVPGHRLILSGGLTPETVGAAVTTVAPFAVDVSSGIQIDGDPRRKDRARMERFVSEVLAADARRTHRRLGVS
jgi:phosphoribosylanthranilate isomerase